MKVAFFVNDVQTEIDEFTTTRLAMAAGKRGHEVWYVGLGEVAYCADGRLKARAYPGRYEDRDHLNSYLERVKESDPDDSFDLQGCDAVWLRNDSIEDLHDRPWAFNVGVEFGQMLVKRGVTVVNDPIGLSRAGSKLYLQEFPEHIRPRGIATRNRDEIHAFIEEVGRSVIKPLYGAKGRNVFIIEGPDEGNLVQMIDAVLEDGYVTVQEFVDGGEEGDMRIFVLEGEPMHSNGTYAAFKRVPQGKDLRANISTGGRPQDAELTDTEIKVVAAMKDHLLADGMFFVGIDLIGSKVVEINAESPGGLQAVEHFSGLDFGLTISEALEKKVEREAK